MILLGQPEGKRPLERHGYQWEDNIKVDLKEIRWGGVQWIDLTQRALANITVMNEPSGFMKWGILK
jgi:hypothetical protein